MVKHACIISTVITLLAQVHRAVLVDVCIAERGFVFLHLVAVHDLLLVLQVHSRVQILCRIIFHGDTVQLQVFSQVSSYMQKIFITNLANMPDFILEHMFAVLGQILARVHGVRFLQMMVHGPVEAGVITVTFLALVDRVVLVHVRVAERGLILYPFGLYYQLFLVFVNQSL